MFRSEDFLGKQWISPAEDKVSIAHRYSTKWHIDECLKHTKKRGAVVQAGGNLGQWPHYLSGLFERVYTFEPDPTNFECLVHNLRGQKNVYKFQTALGDGTVGTAHIESVSDNCEGNFIGETGRLCPVNNIDSLVNDEVDLILLDLEGYEYFALLGAWETLEWQGPVVLIENRLQDRYKTNLAQIENLLSRFDYKLVGQASKDLIYAR